MKNFSKIFFTLLILDFIPILSKKIFLEYNEELDYITKDGKKYFPISEDNIPPSFKNLRTQNQIRKTEEKEAEPCVRN